MTTGIVIAAAGHGARFRQAGGTGHKLMAQFSDQYGELRTVFAHSLHHALGSGLPVVVVTREEQQGIRQLCQQQQVPVALVDNNSLGRSIAAGVRLSADWDGWIIQLADMPFIDAALFQTLAGCLRPEGVVRPVYQGLPGHPVGFGAATRNALLTLTAEEGARQLMQLYPLTLLEMDNPAVQRDIDYPAQLKFFLR